MSRSYIKESLRQMMEEQQRQKARRTRTTAKPSEEPPAARSAEDEEPPTLIPRPAGMSLKSLVPDEPRVRPRPRPRPRATPMPPKPEAETTADTLDEEESVDEPGFKVDLRSASVKGMPSMLSSIDRPLIEAPPPTRFRPLEPKGLEDAGLDPTFIEELILKYLLTQPGTTGRQIATSICLNHRPVHKVLQSLKDQKYLYHRQGTVTGDFNFVITELGRNRCLDIMRHSRYVGPAPVPLQQWLKSVNQQSISNERPQLKDLKRAFHDLLVPDKLLHQLGPAVTSGKGLFLFGSPGNGKTSLAERMTRAFGTSVYIPYAILVEGTLIKVFDPMVHEIIDEDERTLSARERIDPRWVKCRRPTVVAGGELTMDSLEIDFDARSGVSEAPIQMKANCGTLVIDDFGRQRVDPATLLNRWIVPLEQRVDYLRLPDGRKVQVPFDPLLVFSTNLDPKDLCDEAFLRRIPYKVEVADPSEASFRKLLQSQAEQLGFEVEKYCFDYLIDVHYKRTGRAFRNCHPRDLILQVYNQCLFRESPMKLTRAGFDEAAAAYFTLL